MSNTLLYDPLLVHYLAAELDERLRGRLCAGGLTFTGERSAVLPLSDRQALSLDLHPTRGWIRIVPWDGDEALEGECLGVSAPADERLLRISLDLPDRFRGGSRALVVELHTNQWNVLLLDEAERIISLAWSRNAGGRALRSGVPYAPPNPSDRIGGPGTSEADAWSEWRRTVSAAGPDERRRALLGRFAFTGALNADFILSGTGASGPWQAEEAAEREAFGRWWWIRSLPTPRPVLLTVGMRRTPYPFPLGDAAREPVGSLLEGMDRLAASPEQAAPARAMPPLEVRAQARRSAIARRVERLREELAGAEGADAVRASADLLLAKLHEVPRGADEARLLDWEGAEVAIALDPALSAADNAARLYDEARRRVRGAQRVERLLEEAISELERWDLALGAGAGALPDWAVRQLEDAHGSTVSTGQEEPIRPYRTYRTSGGLEVRVGKSGRANDELTFKHSSPNDVWLHAQSVPGSHVVLRWPDAVSAPPARDLEEAAMLAALFSRARTSSLVSVAWTRRKHVRKPRGAAPGSVIPQKVKTVLVEPDPSIAERLRIG